VGHEAIVYGRIIGANGQSGPGYRALQDRNRAVIRRLSQDDNWPWVVRGMFALPASYPMGTYRRQVIHFGLSIKDEPSDRGVWDVWLGKFEAVLRRLYWLSAVAHLTTDFEPPRVFEWVLTEAAMGQLYDDPPQPVSEWVRSVRYNRSTQTNPETSPADS
jgi:hypothetical protein